MVDSVNATGAPTSGHAPPKPTIDKAVVEKDVSWIGARLREPSTYAGLAALLAVVGVGAGSDLIKDISMIGMGIGGLVAIILPDARKAVGAVILGLGMAMLALGGGAHAATPLPKPRPAAVAVHAAPASGTVTQTQALQNPVLVIQQFSVADLQAALADAQAQTPPDATSAACYTALIPIVQSNLANPLPQGPGIFQALQKIRDAKALLANLQSPTGPLAGLNTACAPLILDGENTLIQLGVLGGAVAVTGGAAGLLPALPLTLPFPLPISIPGL